MTRITIILHDKVASVLRESASASVEVAGVLIVGVSETDGEVRFLGREFVPAPAEAYVEQTACSLDLLSSAYMPAVARAQALGAAAIFVHTHPDTAPEMSPDDDRVDELLRSVFQIRTRSRFYASAVFHLDGPTLLFSGRAWRDDEPIGSISLLREVGDRFIFTSSIDAPDPIPPAEIFDRQVRAFGPAIQQLLATLHVGIVGAGGTGSSTSEMLIRLGVGEITVVDGQELTGTNITRVYGSGSRDEGSPKVDIVEANAKWIGLGTNVHKIKAAVSRGVLDALRACDVIFACTDDHPGRLDVARLAYWCLIPVFDLGALIDSKDEILRGIYSRVDVQLPGTPCVLCWGVVDPVRLSQAQLPPDELEGLRKEGYAAELDDPDPAVIAYTTISAALAINELILRLTGVHPEPIARTMLFAHDRRLQLRTKAGASGHWCSDPTNWGAGVTRRYLGRSWAK